MEMFVTFAELNDGEGKPFEFLRTGTFTDANGRKVEVTEQVLDDLVGSFNEGAAGQEVPIDVDHKREEAAGWIEKLVRDGDRLHAIPRWNELGRQLVGDRMYRYVSATMDLGLKVLRSISLTNFPAVKDLKPVELAEAIAADVRATVEAHAEKGSGAKSEIVVVMLGGFAMSGQAEVKDEVKTEVVVETPVVKEEVKTEAVGKVDLSAKDITTHVKSVEVVANGKTVDLAAFMAEARKEIAAEFSAQLAREIQKTREEAADIVNVALAEMRQENELVSFSERITTSGRHALPVEPKVVAEVLRGMPPAKQQAVRTLLDTIAVHGTVDFSEVGTSAGKDEGGAKPRLQGKERDTVVEFMELGMTIEEVFRDAGDLLGPIEKYDLSEFAAK